MTQHNGIPRCTAQRRSGQFCDAPSMEDAPFPICRGHAEDVFQHMKAGVTSQLDLARQALFSRARRDGPNPDRPSVVYYVRELDGSIKIGVTQHLDSRLQQLRLLPDALLATEPGGMDVERARHRQFAHLRVGRHERFRPERDLMDHIKAVTRHAMSDS